jgi:16S rRNA (adenine1518-N6/adenine1519-N6)-dimethyltransferase
MIDYNSPKALKEVLQNRGLGMQKKFGQNFLIDQAHREKILKAFDAKKDELLWEIGPGFGALTHKLPTERLFLFEIDHGFIDFLSDEFPCTIVEGDFRKTWKTALESGTPDGIIGNLPYNVGSLMIAELIESGLRPKRFVFTVQDEVARRICAPIPDRNGSSFSYLCQLYCSTKYLGNIPGSAFYPKPEVRSAVVKLTPLENPVACDGSYASRVLRVLFLSRRKTMKNNIQRSDDSKMKAQLLEAASEMDLDLSRRVESLSLGEMRALLERACQIK